MQFLVDMKLSPRWTAVLIQAGFGATHWSEHGRSNAPDIELLRYAREHGQCIFTHDLDFGMLIARTRATGPSVVQLREQRVDPDEIGPIVVRALRLAAADLDRGALVTISLQRSKVSILPIL